MWTSKLSSITYTTYYIILMILHMRGCIYIMDARLPKHELELLNIDNFININCINFDKYRQLLL